MIAVSVTHVCTLKARYNDSLPAFLSIKVGPINLYVLKSNKFARKSHI